MFDSYGITHIYMQFFPKVQVIEEILAYKFPDLVADFGGYLGLLLGASIVSMYDIIFEMVKIHIMSVFEYFIKRTNEQY